MMKVRALSAAAYAKAMSAANASWSCLYLVWGWLGGWPIAAVVVLRLGPVELV